MAQIIDFNSARVSRPMRPIPMDEACEIHFFLGVRYERMPEPTPEPASRTRQGKSRARKRRA